MTPKEKAKELFDKYVKLSGIYIGDYENEKQMCLIAVDEIINCDYFFDVYKDAQKFTSYWYEVKQEIEKL